MAAFDLSKELVDEQAHVHDHGDFTRAPDATPDGLLALWFKYIPLIEAAAVDAHERRRLLVKCFGKGPYAFIGSRVPPEWTVGSGPHRALASDTWRSTHIGPAPSQLRVDMFSVREGGRLEFQITNPATDPDAARILALYPDTAFVLYMRARPDERGHMVSMPPLRSVIDVQDIRDGHIAQCTVTAVGRRYIVAEYA